MSHMQIFVSMLAVCLTLVSSGEDLVRNGDFGEGTVGWSIPNSGLYKWEKNGGYNGSQGLVFLNEDLEKTAPGYPGQTLKLKQGQEYRFSGRVMATKNPKAKGDFMVFLLVSVCNKDGKWLCEYWSKTVKDTKGEWVVVEGKTPPLPPQGAIFSVRMVASGAGSAAFDEISVSPLDVPPVCGFSSTAYRDTAWEGKVRFDANLAIDPDRLPMKGLVAECAFATADGTTRRVRMDSFDRLSASLEIDVCSLPIGTYPVSFELRNAKGDLVGSETIMFTRTKTKPVRRVEIDHHGRTIVDGKPFFPLGFYHANITGSILDIYCKGRFNCVLPYMYISREMMDECHRRGIMVIPCLITYNLPGTLCPVKGFRTQEDTDRAVLVRMNEIKDHPALLAWYTTDETPISMRPRLRRRYELVKAADPEHPIYGVFCQLDQIRGYRATCDVLGTDQYPIGRAPISLAAEQTRTAMAGMGWPALWQVPQAFDWRWFGKKGDGFRMPTKAEARSMSWQMIANGSNGLIYYCFHHMLSDQPRKGFDRDWKMFCEISEEIAPVIPVLVSDPAPNATGYAQGVSGRAWRKDGSYYLLVVNEQEKPNAANLTLPESFASVTQSLDNVDAVLKGRRLSFTLPSLGATLFRLKK